MASGWWNSPVVVRARTFRVLQLLPALVLASAPALALAGAPLSAAPIARGKVIAANGTASGVSDCLECHGGKGEGQAEAGIPRLAGLDATYLDHQLVAFANGTRDNDQMTPVAKAMDAATMADVAAYYASLPPVTTPAAAQAPQQDAIAAGRSLASRGDWATRIPPCASCHGSAGLGVGSAFPPVAGQAAIYIVDQLHAWKSGTRHDDPLGLMKTVATRLDERQITDVAAFYATLPPSPGPQSASPSREP